MPAGSDITLSLPGVPRFLREGPDNTRIENQDLTLIPATDDFESFEIILASGESYTVSLMDGSASDYVNMNDDQAIFLSIFDFNDTAFLANVFVSVRGEDDLAQLNDGWIVFGQDTQPREVGARRGTAAYRGSAEATLRRDGFIDAFGFGDATLTADFDGGTVSGLITLRDAQQTGVGFAFSPVTVTLTEGVIDENGFAGDIDVTSSSFTSDVADGGYQGRFYGVDAAGVGGNFQGQLTSTVSVQPTFLIGAFIGDAVGE